MLCGFLWTLLGILYKDVPTQLCAYLWRISWIDNKRAQVVLKWPYNARNNPCLHTLNLIWWSGLFPGGMLFCFVVFFLREGRSLSILGKNPLMHLPLPLWFCVCYTSGSMLWLREMASLICNFSLSVAARTIVSPDPSLKDTLGYMLLGCWGLKKRIFL